MKHVHETLQGCCHYKNIHICIVLYLLYCIHFIVLYVHERLSSGHLDSGLEEEQIDMLPIAAIEGNLRPVPTDTCTSAQTHHIQVGENPGRVEMEKLEHRRGGIEVGLQKSFN